MAMQSGRFAGETLADAWRRDDFSESALSAYPQRLRESAVWSQLRRVRNVRAPFSTHMALGVIGAGCAWATGGALPWWTVGMEPDHQALRPAGRNGRHSDSPPPLSPHNPDRLTDLFQSGTRHDEDQPCHLHILDRATCKECIGRFGAPCQHFCPAEVYHLEEGRIHVDFSNCLHCKTCQIKDLYQNIRWTAPHGGDGPRYTRM